MSHSSPETMGMRQPRGISLATMLIGLTMVALGIIWLLDASDVLAVSWYAVFAVVLMILGLGLVVGSFTGDHGGLIALGIVLTVLLTFASWTDIRFDGAIGDRDFAPAAIEEVEDSYRVTAGTLTLDLSQVVFPPGETIVEARVFAGEMHVVVPPELAVEVNWRVAAGEARVFNEERSGALMEESTSTHDHHLADSRLTLDLIVIAGQIEVRR